MHRRRLRKRGFQLHSKKRPARRWCTRPRRGARHAVAARVPRYYPSPPPPPPFLAMATAGDAGAAGLAKSIRGSGESTQFDLGGQVTPWSPAAAEGWMPILACLIQLSCAGRVPLCAGTPPRALESWWHVDARAAPLSRAAHHTATGSVPQRACSSFTGNKSLALRRRNAGGLARAVLASRRSSSSTFTGHFLSGVAGRPRPSRIPSFFPRWCASRLSWAAARARAKSESPGSTPAVGGRGPRVPPHAAVPAHADARGPVPLRYGESLAKDFRCPAARHTPLPPSPPAPPPQPHHAWLSGVAKGAAPVTRVTRVCTRSTSLRGIGFADDRGASVCMECAGDPPRAPNEPRAPSGYSRVSCCHANLVAW